MKRFCGDARISGLSMVFGLVVVDVLSVGVSD